MEFNGFHICDIQREITASTNLYTWDALRCLADRKIFWLAKCSNSNIHLPKGYKAYVVSPEGADVSWLKQQRQRVDGPIFCLNLVINTYDIFKDIPDLYWLPWTDWHRQMQKMLDVFGSKVTKNIQHKISALMAMTRLNRAVTLSAIMEIFAPQDRMVSHLSVCHTSRDTEFERIDHYDLINRHIDNYNTRIKHQAMLIDEFKQHRLGDPSFENLIKSYDFTTPPYQTCAVNVTNESTLQSHRVTDAGHEIIPGPWLTEKTLKCLLGETAFIANGNWHTYRTLKHLGFNFDYGFDLDYDEELGDYTRLQLMISLLTHLQQYSAGDLFEMTRESCLHNKHHIMSGDFAKVCDTVNQESLDFILSRT